MIATSSSAAAVGCFFRYFSAASSAEHQRAFRDVHRSLAPSLWCRQKFVEPLVDAVELGLDVAQGPQD
jgi:hypothetical protein